MNFEQSITKNIKENRETRLNVAEALDQEKMQLNHATYKKKITTLALGAFLLVSATVEVSKAAESGIKEGSKLEKIEKAGQESAALKLILNKIMENKLADNAPQIEKNRKYRSAVVQLFMFVESQSNKEAAIKTLESAMGSPDVQQDKELSQALRAATSKYSRGR